MQNRYELVRLLGEGGQGSVCLVKDRERQGLLLALKRLDEERSAEELAVEFGYLSKLRHPSLARAVDFGVDEEGAFFTSEFVDGEPILDWTKGASREEVARALAALLRVLALLHDRDLVHGDVTSENVMMVKADKPTGQAVLKLLDLGGACRPGELGTGSTAGFAAPEILSGRGALPASDLYAFGALLSWALLGRAPFGSKDASSVVQRQLAGEPTLPDASLSPTAALVRELLSPDPSGRPSSALDTLERLAAATEMDLGVRFESLTADHLPSPRIIQRDRELSLLMGVVDQLDSDRGHRVAVLRGPGESGLSTLLEEVSRHAQLNGMGALGEIHAPARADTLLGTLVDSIDIDRLSLASRKALAPWAGAFRPQGNKPSESWSASVGFAAVEAFSLACDAKPQLLVIDDFQESDRLVQEVVTTMARSLSPERSERPRGAMVIALQESPSLEAEPLSGLQIKVSALDAAGTDQLVSSMLPGISWPSHLPKTVFLTSNGLPKTAEQVVRQSVGPGGELTLHDKIGEMVTHLPGSSRALIAVIGRLDKPVDETLIHRAGISPESVESLIQSGFLYESMSGIGPHISINAAALAAKAAEDKTTEEERAGFGRKLAELFADAGDLEAAAELWRHIGDTSKAAAAYAKLARQELGRGNFASSGEWFEKALEASSEPRGDLAREAVTTWHAIGWYDQALRALSIANVDQETRDRLEAEITLEKGLHPQARALASSAKKRSPHNLDLDVIIAACELQLGHHERVLGIASEILDGERKASKSSAYPRLSQIAGLACTYLDKTEEASARFQQAKAAFEASGDLLGQLKVSANLGMLQRARGNLAEARASYDKAIQLTRELGDRPREALHLMNRATVQQVACNFETALNDYRSARDIAAVLGNTFRMIQVELNLADLLLDLGDRREASKMAVSALERCRELGQARLETRALLVAGQAALKAGDPVRAERRLLEARRRFAAAGDEAGRVSADQQLTALLLARGDTTSASKLAKETADATEKKGRWRENARALIQLAAAELEAGRDLKTALEVLDQAEHSLKREPAPDFLWRLELLRARVLKGLGKANDAKRGLEKAKLLFENVLGQVPDRFRASYIECAGAEEITASSHAGKEEPTDRWARDLEMLIEITQELTRERDPKRLLSLIMESAVELTGAERGMVVMPRGDVLDQVISYEISDEVEKRFSRSVADKVVREGRSVLAVDALDDDRFRAFVSVNAMKLRSILAVPLKIKRRVIGAIYLDSRLRTGVFTDADHRLLEAFGAQAAIALETARLLSENTNRLSDLKQANEEIRRLSEQLQEKLAKSEVKLRRVGALLQKTQKDESERMMRSGIAGRSTAMQKVMKMIDRIALADVPVYIYGASGTGKELAAKAIHSASERREHPFVPVNCGALPPKLLASELFGHKKGAFTGAVGDRPGLFKLADKGTLFLDEVSDMDKEMQTHLLRVLQDGTFRSLGDNEEISVDVRILSASNRDLEDEIKAGRFREDLFYRLNVVRIDVPPLSERRDDIPLLVEHLAERHTGGRAPTFSKEAMDALMGAEWPGNVRELENEVLRAITMAGDSNTITVDDLSPRLTRGSAGEMFTGQGSLKDRVNQFEGVIIKRVLEECDDNATKAAAALGISRATLYKKLERFGIDRS